MFTPLEHLHLGPEPDQIIVDGGTPKPGPAHEEQRRENDAGHQENPAQYMRPAPITLRREEAVGGSEYG